MRLKKSLGQHLLKHKPTLRRIVEAAGVGPGDPVLEIGPGGGALTLALLEAGARVAAIEKDDRFAGALAARAAADPALPLLVIHEDALHADLDAAVARLGLGQVRVIANLPYNVGTPIVLRLLDRPDLFCGIVALLQDEVAQRLAAEPGGAARGSLSVHCQMRAETRLLFPVKPELFSPPPRVMSRLVRLCPRQDGPPHAVQDPGVFDRIVRGGFEHRRKTCYNSIRFSLKSGACDSLAPGPLQRDFVDELFRIAELDTAVRPHCVTNAQWAALANAAAHLIANA